MFGGLGLFARGDDVDELATLAEAELHRAVRLREQGVVAALADVLAGVEPGAPLAHDDRARVHLGAAVDLHAQTLGVRVTTVARGRRALLLRHLGVLLLAGRRDADDLDDREVLAVAVAATVVALRLVDEAVDLGASGLADHTRLDDRAVELRGRGLHGLAVDHEDRRELDLAAVVESQALHLELLTGLDLVLLPTGANHCIHKATMLLHRLQQSFVEDEAPPVARRARAAERLHESLRDALAGHLDQPQLRHLERLGAGLVAGQGVAEDLHPLVAVLLDLHVDEVDHDDPADVAQPQLAGDLLGGLEVVPEDRLLEVRLAHVLAGVHVDHGERLGALDDERPTRGEPDLPVERLEQLLGDVEALEDREALLLRVVELDAVGELGRDRLD